MAYKIPPLYNSLLIFSLSQNIFTTLVCLLDILILCSNLFIIEICTLNFMFLTRKLAGSVKYIVFGVLFYNGERKKINVPKEGRFCRVCEHKD